ncbi:MAG TPA: UDP-N-acetylmuramoyl-tripeptide--D-alanyl-D-alanine ligase [Verrucomicrobiae bacterium]|jgi:UDP-N-acetylmuramoyl-tripeptide--D-alanyl-D-alanine ligase|nr:UDP-N-acetylmuramoyl-tripeptide--D-alanyl-D-alanine ligase [Verrucomicrobiae bacterium]
MSLPFEVAVQALDATVLDASHAPHDVRVSTDTRTISTGDTFLALRGERFNGHNYVREAIAKGADLLVVDDANARLSGVTTLVVKDTLQAYMTLAQTARERFAGRVVGITGSVGKTTTKELLGQLLSLRFGDRIAASPANENNEIGVSKFLLANADASHDVLVVEMGARHYDDIAPLVHVARPDIGVLTNVGEAHVEIMGSLERLAHTKWGLFSGGALAILNARDEVSLQRAPSLLEAPHWFGAGAERISTGGRTTLIVGTDRLLEIDSRDVLERAIDVRLPGAHNRANLAAAIAAARELGVEVDAVVDAIPDLHLPPGRFERIAIAGRPLIVYDAYNANLTGMLAALDAFADEPAQRRIVVLAGMAELGEEASAMHERVGERAAAKGVDVLLIGGDYVDALERGAKNGGLSSERIVRFATNSDAARWLEENAHPGDAVLLKGSRVYKLEEVVELLQGGAR